MQAVANADSLTGGIKAAITELGDEKGHAPFGKVVDAVRSNRPATAEDVHDRIEALEKDGDVYSVASKIAVADRDAVVTDGGSTVTVIELRNRAAQARVARAEAALEHQDLGMAERCHKDAMSYRRRANRMVRGDPVTDGGMIDPEDAADEPSPTDPSSRMGEVLKQYELANKEIDCEVGSLLNKLAIDAASVERHTDADVEVTVKRNGHATLFAMFPEAVTPAEATSAIAGVTNADKTLTSRSSDAIVIRAMYGERYRKEVEAAQGVSSDE